MFTKDDIIKAIKNSAITLGHTPSKREFIAGSDISEYHILGQFPSWADALVAAGLTIDFSNIRINDDDLLADWGMMVRRLGHIPSSIHYRREGKYSVKVFNKHFGSWSGIPEEFKKIYSNNPEWADVIALLPQSVSNDILPCDTPEVQIGNLSPEPNNLRPQQKNKKLQDRLTYGNPLNFRGLQHEPVNEEGVVFLFGMVARELGFIVEAVQAGFPDCEAKRQIKRGQWQRVKIEFEYESRNFRDHGHPIDGCDIIICWNHNWVDCPPNLEIIELSKIIRSLAASDE
jgi:hypothetical protein